MCDSVESNHGPRSFNPALYQLSYNRIADGVGIEPTQPVLETSSPALGHARLCSAQSRDRTDNLLFGRQALHQLSYSRLWDVMDSNHQG